MSLLYDVIFAKRKNYGIRIENAANKPWNGSTAYVVRTSFIYMQRYTCTWRERHTDRDCVCLCVSPSLSISLLSCLVAVAHRRCTSWPLCRQRSTMKETHNRNNCTAFATAVYMCLFDYLRASIYSLNELLDNN